MTRPGVREAYYCSAEVIRERRRCGQPIPQWLHRHHAELEREVHRLSRPRHQDDEIGCDLGESNQIGAREAAALLGWSIRKVQRRKEDLGGRLIGVSLVFDRSVVLEHARKGRE
jgi:hypothetical protein